MNNKKNLIFQIDVFFVKYHTEWITETHLNSARKKTRQLNKKVVLLSKI